MRLEPVSFFNPGLFLAFFTGTMQENTFGFNPLRLKFHRFLRPDRAFCRLIRKNTRYSAQKFTRRHYGAFRFALDFCHIGQRDTQIFDVRQGFPRLSVLKIPV